MKILAACEESQAVTIELRRLGHEAYSCDLYDCSGGYPQWHIQGDVLPLINGNCNFTTMDGINHKITCKWDMLIAFPPCTYLSNAGANKLFLQGKLNVERYQKGLEGKEFFMQFINADCDKIAVENPVASKIYNLPPYSQIIQPWEHGHPYQKKTCLWLKGLPLLEPTKIVRKDVISWVSGGSKDNNGNKRKQSSTVFRNPKIRAKTFPGIAKAMAEQWTADFEIYPQLSFEKLAELNKIAI